MSWRACGVAVDGTHHIISGVPLYAERFDQVLKFHAPGLAPVHRGKEGWHIHPDGSAAYVRRFERTFGFYEGVAAVVSADGWHHVLPDGRDAYAARYDWCGNYQGGRCTVRERSGTYFHLAPDGSAAYEARWRYAGDFRDGVGVVQASDGRSTHIDLEGRPVHASWFLDLDVFHKGFARARDDHGWTHVGLDGHPAYARRFAAVEPFYNGQARVERFDGGLEVIDELGQPVAELRPPLRSEFAQLSADMVGYWRTAAIATSVELGVPEALPGVEVGIATQCGVPTAAVLRLLRAMGELGLARREGGTWRLSSRGQYLRRDHPMTLADAALEYAGPLGDAWRHLAADLRRGGEGIDEGPDVFAIVGGDPLRCRGHHRMLRSYAHHDYPAVVRSLRFGAGERVVDAGGGLGALALLVAEGNPEVVVTVLDRPEVVELGKEQRHDAPNVSWRGADLFDEWQVRSDTVLLSRVLHDWDDTAAIQILKRAKEALDPGGRVVIVEMLLSDEGFAGSLCDLHLLAVTGGRERTVDEYSVLLAAAGLKLTAVWATDALPSVLVGVET